MTITLSQANYWELFEEVDDTKHFDSSDESDVIWKYPKQLGQGYFRAIQLREGLELAIADYQLHDHLISLATDREHPLEFTFYISGGEHGNRDTTISAGQYGFWGSGMAPGETGESSAMQQIRWLSVHLEPELFCSFTSNQSGEIPPDLKHLVRNPTQEYYSRYGATTSAMQVALQQILHCPYQGVTKRMYLEGKVLELMALLLEQEVEAQKGRSDICWLKPDDLDRIHYAREILLRHLDNPPSLMELARQVGLNDCTLKRGFRLCFGTTAFGYLHNYRLEQARQLLVTGEMKVAEVALAVGFADRSYFAAAFRKKFGLNPKEFLKKYKSV